MSSREFPGAEGHDKHRSCPHQQSRHGVVVVFVQMTLPVVGDHDARHLAVHPKVGVCVAGKH